MFGKKPLYICDLDDTLTLTDHRQHILDLKHPDKWNMFYDACYHDAPNKPVIDTIHALYKNGADIWFFTGRSSRVRTKTINWLLKHTNIDSKKIINNLKMRPEGDITTPDHEFKARWYNEMRPKDKKRLVAVFDDRNTVVSMWRSLGVACFQVQEGDF